MRKASIMATIIVATFMRPDAATANNRAPSLDLDVLSSVVAIEVDGAFAGTGVVVTQGGYVLTSYEFAVARLRDNKPIVIGKDLRRTASVVQLDVALGVAVLQMHGVIPRPATIAVADRDSRGSAIAVCRTADDATMQIEVRGREPLPECAVCPVFSSRTGTLKGVMVSRAKDGRPAYLGVAAIRLLIRQASGDHVRSDDRTKG